MTDETEPTLKDRKNSEDAILPGLGMVAGIFFGVVLWQFVDDWVTLGPVGVRLVQGFFFATCIFIASMIDGLIRPKGWGWRYRLKRTTWLAASIIVLWGIAAIGHAVGGKNAAAGSWLFGFVLLAYAEWWMRRATRQEKVADVEED
jgi:hypothetical protein